MGLTVAELLKTEVGAEMKVVCGAEGLKNEIRGVTIIEAPDIVRWIEGGEVLLTGLYAFRTCSREEFRSYIYELRKKNVSALILKRKKTVEDESYMREFLKEFSESFHVPLIEVAYEVSFQTVMSAIMERLFNEEVTRLKFFKTTHDNFSALAFSERNSDNVVENILDMLDKLIRNPVAAYNENMACLGTSNPDYVDFQLKKSARKYDPGIFTNYRYFRQHGEPSQYVVRVNLGADRELFLVVTEVESPFGGLDCIAIENAIIALRYELSRRYAVAELERKFQTDILHNIVNGKVASMEELKKNSRLLGLSMETSYRVLVLGISDDGNGKKELNSRIHYAQLLEKIASDFLPDTRGYRDLEKIVLIQKVEEKQTQEEYREALRAGMEKIQEALAQENKHLRAKVGVGKVVNGVRRLSKSYWEADDAFSFIDIAGEISEEGGSQMMLFSDLGIFKLLCQLDDPNQLLEYVPESLQKLYHYKKPQRDDLIITLKTYLDRNQNLSKTAQDLYVHYKTAAYRIEKITKITGMDFDNANEVLAVRIGLVVYRMIENYSRKLL